MDRAALRSQLERHEGLRLKPYRCTEGKLTIGYGRNIEDNGISREEADFLLDNDIDAIEAELKRLPAYNTLNQARQTVLANMAFNLGTPSLMRFRKMWAALDMMQWQQAADEMLDSRWAQQVGNRAKELAAVMVAGRIT
ncbi:glycoside hydrolase family protein [uncultured Marinobacter sp.]|uniref:glycoside hydrolase family protein n=1 Tax=uncultured Marinobacter sp. TaxID=187379 RepID=UPI0030DDBC8D